MVLARRGAVAQIGRMENPVLERYVVRPGSKGFRVVDVWTGQTAEIGGAPQDKLSDADASHTARLLNARVADGERRPVD
jgi:hypothetical protein